MVATVNVVEGNGASVSWQTITSARFCTQDSYNPGTTFPVPIPDAGTINRSFWKNHALDLSGTFNNITDIKWYCDGAIGWNLGSGGKCIIGKRDSGDNGCPTGSYTQGTGTSGVTGDKIEESHPFYSGQTTKVSNVISYTSSSPLTVDTTNYGSASKTKHVVTQVLVDSSENGAVQGEQTDETFTFLYTES